MEIRDILKEAAQNKVITDEGIFFPYGLATVGMFEKLPLSCVLFIKKSSEDKKIILSYEGKPIFEIAVSYNCDDYENLFQLDFYYFKEDSKDKITPVKTYKIKKSVGVLRYWTAVNIFDESDIPTRHFATEIDKFKFLARDAIAYSIDIMRDNKQNTLYSLPVDNNYGLKESLERLLPCLVNWYEAYSTIVKFNPDLYINQINIRRKNLQDQIERFNAIILEKGDIIPNYPLAQLDLERYYNYFLKMFEADEEAALKMKECSKSGPNK